MFRKALLIVSPGNPHLEGVTMDLLNIKNYLCSSVGGGWDLDSEIIILNSPSYDEVIHHLKSLENYEFGFVYYSGHGFSEHKRTKLQLNAQEIISVEEIANRCKKQITIIDACRTKTEYLNIEGQNQVIPIHFENGNIKAAKKLHQNYLNACSNGKILCFATQLNSYAYESNNGGYFSSHLLQTIKNTVIKNNKQIISIEEVFNKLGTILNHKQILEIEFTNNDVLNFPIALNIEDTKVSLNEINHLKEIVKISFGALSLIGLSYVIKAILTGDEKN